MFRSPTPVPSPPGSLTPAEPIPEVRRLRASTYPRLDLSSAAASSEYAPESERGHSPVLLTSEPSPTGTLIPKVVIDKAQPSPDRLSPDPSWLPDDRLRQSPTISRNNSLFSDPGGGFEEWRCDQPFQFDIPKPKADSDPWETGYKIARDHDKEMCDGWREGIDKLLIFAGLFSAALVAFLSTSCTMLNADPNVVQTALLLHIALRLEYGTNNATIALPPLPSTGDIFRPSSAVIIANMCWFFSLTLALGAVLFGTVCLQWIREFERDPRLGFKEAFEFRQMRYEGLIGWGIPFIISALPLLLQLSLLLFFLGLSFFLQSFDPHIAAAISVLMALIVVFLCVTMVLPAMQCITSSSKSHDQRCSLSPFKSPHARLFGVFAAWSTLFFIAILRFFSRNPRLFEEKREFVKKIFRRGSDWASVDMAWLESSYRSPRSQEDDSPYLPSALAWLARTYAPSHDALCAFYHCLRDTDSSIVIKTLRSFAWIPSTTPLDWIHKYDDDEYSKDIQSAVALDAYVTARPRLHDSLLLHRVELFVRILNQGLISKSRRRPQAQTPDVCSLFIEGRLLVPLVNVSAFVILDNACKVQLIKTFFSYLNAGETHDFLTNVVIKMVHKTVTTRRLRLDRTIKEELSAFNEQLNRIFLGEQGPDEFRHDVKKLVGEYIQQFSGDGYTGVRSSSFKNSLKNLETAFKRKTGAVVV